MVAQVIAPPRAGARRPRPGARIRLPIVVTGIVIVLGLVALLYISQNSAVATLGYDLRRLETDKARWLARNEQLRVEIGQLESVARLETAAARLGMVPPTRVVFVEAPASAIVRVEPTQPLGTTRDPALASTQQPDLLGRATLLLRQLHRGVVEYFAPQATQP